MPSSYISMFGLDIIYYDVRCNYAFLDFISNCSAVYICHLEREYIEIYS